MKDICERSGVTGHKTNHSLRATGATAMYQAEVQTLIQERTGHRSLQALRVYERSTEKQHKAVSAVLSSNSQTTFHSEISKKDIQFTPTSGLTQFSFSNLHGCTININQQQTSSDTPDEEFDHIIQAAIEKKLV